MKEQRISLGLVGILTLLLLVSCLSKSKQIHSYRSIPNQTWVWGDTLLYNCQLSDLLARYQLTIEFRHNDHYPFQNLALWYSISPTNEAAICSDTLNFMLCNEQGQWRGRKWSNLFEGSIPASTFTIPHSGEYTIRLLHIMRNDTLTGLYDLGVRIESVP